MNNLNNNTYNPFISYDYNKKFENNYYTDRNHFRNSNSSFYSNLLNEIPSRFYKLPYIINKNGIISYRNEANNSHNFNNSNFNYDNNEIRLKQMQEHIKNLEDKTNKLETLNQMYFDIMKTRIQNNINNSNNNNNFDFKKFKNEIAELIKNNNQNKLLESQKINNEIDYNINFMAPNISKNLNETYNYNNSYIYDLNSRNLNKSKSAERFQISNIPSIDNYNKDLNNLIFQQYINQRENNQRISEELNDIKNEIKIRLNRIENEQKNKLNNLSLLLSQNTNKRILQSISTKMINQKNNYNSPFNYTNISHVKKNKNSYRKNKSENHKMKLKLSTKNNDSDVDSLMKRTSQNFKIHNNRYSKEKNKNYKYTPELSNSLSKL